MHGFFLLCYGGTPVALEFGGHGIIRVCPIMENMEIQIIPLIERDKAVAQQTKTRVHPFIRMKQWNLAISAHLSTMEAKKIILQGRKPLSLPSISKRMGKMMIPMETILVVLREGIGGRAHFITNILIQNMQICHPNTVRNTG
ncbi:uncharacterized protein LOC111310163 isoform X3 [Durio zibethinus]|uniref:Uncharacterized protein LOC111310163 isoform X3 n=1 Tax=Durio zibethinus TaxID=66656 RepID=A0A6P6AJS8_DURZI|nr:uncharacterized protein LOC111310163 isoform X3 [Durio zibethinus]